MEAKNRKRAKFGDVIEIDTPEGFAYFQYTHKKPSYGYLIRILPGIYKERPSNFSILIDQKARFFVFFPLNAALNRDIVRIVANEMIPEHAQSFPLMRSPGGRDRSGRVHNWWLWDGEKKWMVGTLSPEQQTLSIAEVLNDTMLIEFIVKGWSPLNDI